MNTKDDSERSLEELPPEEQEKLRSKARAFLDRMIKTNRRQTMLERTPVNSKAIKE